MVENKRLKNIAKEPLIGKLSKEESAFKKYQDFFIGNYNVKEFIKYEFVTSVFGPFPGGVGYVLRKWFYPYLFKKVGSGVQWGKNIALRYTGRIEIGDRVAIDDNCLLDAKGADEGGIEIGSDVLIARGSIIQAKNSWIQIGNRCSIGSQCQLSSVGGIKFGDHVMLAGQCYIGGGRYHVDNMEVPMMDQGLYSEGPLVINDDVWIGANVSIIDGMEVGKGAVIGAGSLVMKSIPSGAIVSGVPARVISWRSAEGK